MGLGFMGFWGSPEEIVEISNLAGGLEGVGLGIQN